MEQLKFSVQPLLTRKGGKISGPMSPLLFAKEMMAQLDMRYNRLARIWFKDEPVFQRCEYGEQTGYDTIIIGSKYSDGLWLSLWIDEGTKGLPVAMAFEGEAIRTTSIYERAEYLRKLTTAEITQVFDYLFVNQHELNIIEEG